MNNQINYKQLTYPIALAWLNGDQVWKKILEDIIEDLTPTSFDRETTFDSIKNDIKNLIFKELLPYIDENIYDILSEYEIFNERDWDNRTELFKKALNIYLNDQLDRIVKDIIYTNTDSIKGY